MPIKLKEKELGQKNVVPSAAFKPAQVISHWASWAVTGLRAVDVWLELCGQALSSLCPEVEFLEDFLSKQKFSFSVKSVLSVFVTSLYLYQNCLAVVTLLALRSFSTHAVYLWKHTLYSWVSCLIACQHFTHKHEIFACNSGITCLALVSTISTLRC